MKQIAKRQHVEMPAPDSAGNIEFTDWDEIEAFATDVATFVEGRLAIAPPTSGDDRATE